MFNAMAAFNYGFNGFLNGNVAMNYNKGRWGVRVNYNGKYERTSSRANCTGKS